MSVSGERAVEAGGGAVDRRRRRWSEAQKRQIVAESREPGVSVSVVARRYNVNANQVFTWRRQYCEPEGDAEAGRLVPVDVARHCQPHAILRPTSLREGAFSNRFLVGWEKRSRPLSGARPTASLNSGSPRNASQSSASS